MAGLTGSGYPLPAGLRLMKKQCARKEQKLLDTLIQGVEQGRPLSRLLLQEGFPALLHSLVVVGEASGDLSGSFRRLSEYYEDRISFRKEIGNAVFYPSLVCVAAVITTLFLLYVVLPQFEFLYTQMNFPVPEGTKHLFRLARVLRQALPWAGGACTILFLLLFLYRIPLAILLQEHLARLLYLPLVKKIYRMILSHRLVENLSLLLSAGIPILQVLQHMAEGAWLPFERQTVAAIREMILAGSTLSEALAAQPWMDVRVLLAVEVAEATGDLPVACETVARELSGELRTKSKRFVQWLEPCLLLIVGGIIGGMTLATLLPMMEMVQSIR
jgi:type II secretory pathway component PulF